MSNKQNNQSITVDCLQYSNPTRERFLEWQKGNVGCVHVTVAVWETARETLSVLGKWNDLLEENKDLIAKATTHDEIEKVVQSGRTAVIFGFQNTAPFEDDIRLIRVFHELGIRIVQLTYNTQNSIASGCWEDNDSGLSTHVGRQFVKELNDVGMLIDLSHCSEKTSLDTIHESRAPVAVTHANPLEYVGEEVALGRRPKSSKVLSELVSRGGIVGLSPYVRMLRNGVRTTESEFVDMIAWTAEKFGVDHVALGTDFYTGYGIDMVKWWRMGRWARVNPVPIDENAPVVEWPTWFQSPAAFPDLAQAMLDKGFTDHEVQKIFGGNWMNLFRTIFDGETV